MKLGNSCHSLIVLLGLAGSLACSGDLAGERGNDGQRGLGVSSKSCEGFCGGKSDKGCWCDEKCSTHGDCCSDKVLTCDHREPSCKDACGGKSPDGCWCDESCVANGDCCSDVATQCSVSAPKPQPGEMVFTELMPNPRRASDHQGEWFELANVTGKVLDLSGCELVGGAERDRVTLPPMKTLEVQPNALMVFAKNSSARENGGIEGVTWAFSDKLSLVNEGDDLTLVCNGKDIDRVSFRPGWAYDKGISMSLSANVTTASANDHPGSWCAAKTPFGAGDLGTPGTTNPTCPPDRCAGVSCDAAPVAACVDGRTLRHYASSGSCRDGACEYAYTDEVCETGCSNGACNTCTWDSLFMTTYGQAWDPNDVAFVTADGAEVRGVTSLDLQRQKTWSSSGRVYVKGSNSPVTEVRLMSKNAWQVLARRTGKYIDPSLRHALWSEVSYPAPGLTAEVLKKQFLLVEPTHDQMIGELGALVEIVKTKLASDKVGAFEVAASILMNDAAMDRIELPLGEIGAINRTYGNYLFVVHTTLGRGMILQAVEGGTKNTSAGLDPVPTCGGCQTREFAGGKLLVCSETLKRHQAQARCEARAGNLASFGSLYENYLARSMYGEGSRWFGLTDEAQEGRFTYPDGSPVAFANWMKDQPDNYGADGEDCVELADFHHNLGNWRALAGWNDLTCEAERGYICRIP